MLFAVNTEVRIWLVRQVFSKFSLICLQLPVLISDSTDHNLSSYTEQSILLNGFVLFSLLPSFSSRETGFFDHMETKTF